MNSYKFMKILLGTIFILAAVAYTVHASECEELSDGKCSKSSGWDPLEKLEQIGTGREGPNQSQSQTSWPKVSRVKRWNMSESGFDETGAASASIQDANGSEITESYSVPANLDPKRSGSFYEMLSPLSNISQFDVILDVSDGVKKFIPGAVHINYKDFQRDGKPRPDLELAEILGGAGISNNSSVVIYGECQPCGGGPAVSTYVYWVMRYLGHDREKIRVLDGGIVNWAASNHSLANSSQIRPKTNYTIPSGASLQKIELLATYEEVNSSRLQIVDCRTALNFFNDSIPGSFNIPHDTLLIDGRIKDEAALKEIGLNKSETVVVYSETGIKASLLWFILEHMGYKAKLYTWQDWKENEIKGQFGEMYQAS